MGESRKRIEGSLRKVVFFSSSHIIFNIWAVSVRHLDKIGSEEDWDDDEIGQYIGGTLSRMSKELKVVVS